MAVDASGLRRRRGLGAPPTEGTPGIEGTELSVREKDYRPSQPPFLDRTPAPTAAAQAEALPNPAADSTGSLKPDPVTVALVPAPSLVADTSGVGEEVAFTTLSRLSPSATRSSGEGIAATQRQRVPPPEAEPRVPFTTRVTVSTKERLENACYHLRRKHQDFINEAILAHLSKHDF